MESTMESSHAERILPIRTQNGFVESDKASNSYVESNKESHRIVICFSNDKNNIHKGEWPFPLNNLPEYAKNLSLLLDCLKDQRAQGAEAFALSKCIVLPAGHHAQGRVQSTVFYLKQCIEFMRSDSYKAIIRDKAISTTATISNGTSTAISDEELLLGMRIWTSFAPPIRELQIDNPLQDGLTSVLQRISDILGASPRFMFRVTERIEAAKARADKLRQHMEEWNPSLDNFLGCELRSRFHYNEYVSKRINRSVKDNTYIHIIFSGSDLYRHVPITQIDNGITVGEDYVLEHLPVLARALFNAAVGISDPEYEPVYFHPCAEIQQALAPKSLMLADVPGFGPSDQLIIWDQFLEYMAQSSHVDQVHNQIADDLVASKLTKLAFLGLSFLFEFEAYEGRCMELDAAIIPEAYKVMKLLGGDDNIKLKNYLEERLPTRFIVEYDFRMLRI